MNLRAVNPENACRQEICCLIDTGARHSIFDRFVCDRTDHNFEGQGVKVDSSSGLGNDILLTRLHTFELNLLEHNTDNVVWNSSPMEIQCASLPDGIPCILGYDDFLKFFRIDIDYPAGVFTLHVK